ncbi:LOW QUALITY PROTEIN: Integrase catalytic core protein [Phytophthora palmivora]|uniref:Integrase catalytic core protein n=1 Tax=Phytophthora palmivora TaxID=4796 RepID=A0A2P4YRD6_9STRA|nr:LOW QUALITY PROTEIN: Integrase catalytic core protein [Phytophthora palmivora]
MEHAGCPISLWPEALRNDVYVKNRVYNKGTMGIPYQMMFGIKPDVHHIRKFDSLAYVHVPVTPGRRKLHQNAKIGFVLGYAEDVVGCKMYFPREHTANFVTDLRVAEDVVYRDRHNVDLDEEDLASLHFTPIVRNDEILQSSTTSVATDEEGEAAGHELMDTECADTEHAQYETIGNQIGTGDCNHDDVDMNIRAISIAVTTNVAAPITSFWTSLCMTIGASRPAVSDRALASNVPTSNQGWHWTSATANASGNEETASVAATRGSSEGNEDLGNADEQDLGDDGDGDITVASVFESNNGSSAHLSTHWSWKKTEEKLEGQSMFATNIQHENDREIINANTVLAANHPRQSGKRTHRDETPSEEERVEISAAKQAKRTRTGLRECNERRRPAYFDGYVMNVTQATSRVLDKNNMPIKAREVPIPRNHREAMRSKYKDFWKLAEMEEMADLKAKGVIEEIPDTEVPHNANAVNTIWMYALKSDFQGYVIRFKARVVPLGNHQRPGIDFRETFAPVARMSSFRLLLALSAELRLQVYGADINMAYLNAGLGISQYLRSIDGYPCKARYGLRQSGREWNSELNKWLIAHGFQRSLAEPCLYYQMKNDKTHYKIKLFTELNKAYGIKDQGLLSQYLGVEVEQTESQIKIMQSKYAKEILTKFGYLNVHAVGNPMEVNGIFHGEDRELCFPHEFGIPVLYREPT